MDGLRIHQRHKISSKCSRDLPILHCLRGIETCEYGPLYKP